MLTPSKFLAFRVKDTVLWSQILWNSWQSYHQFYWALDQTLWDVYSLAENAFALIASIEISTVGCFFLRVLVSVLAFLFSKETYRRFWELQEEWLVEGAIPSQPLSSLQSPFDVSHKLLYKVRSFQGLHFWVSSCWQAKEALWTSLLCDAKQRFQPFLSFSKVSCFQLSLPWSNWWGKKPGWGDECWKLWLWERDHLNKSLLLCQ